ncbi:MAG: PQQ-binding-like beta-propeller repeat protein [Candidatus Sulfotelmatobacter sp.]
MKARKFSPVFILLAIVAAIIPAYSQDVLTYRNNNARTALDAKETILTPSNVNVSTFGKLFTLTVDGKVDAQPLYLSAMAIAGGTHNVLIVATEHDSVYAFDADSGTPYWHITTLKSGETTSDDRGCNQVAPEIGITSTPVIARPAGSNGVIYTVAMSKDSSGDYHQRLHALNAATGAELYKGPVDISAKYPGTGDNSSGGNVIFDPSQYKERSGLLLSNGTVYLTWASHCDIRPYTGWIMAYNSTKLTQTSVLNVTPNGNEGALWGSGAGLAMDSSGNIFALDANGVFDTKLNTSGFPSSGDYGNAVLRFSSTGGKLAVADYFEMYNQENENCCDVDLGSGGVLLLPNLQDGSGTTWQLAAGAGKDGNLYLVNRANLGKFNTSKNNIYQELAGSLLGGMWSSPAYFAGRLYYGPVGSPIFAFQFKNAKLLTKAVAQSANSFAFPGATLAVSSNNGTNAILWATENTNPAVLHAYSPTTLTELYNTNQASGGRDNFGDGNKFITPTIANGKVYVGTTNGVGVFGLLSK